MSASRGYDFLFSSVVQEHERTIAKFLQIQTLLEMQKGWLLKIAEVRKILPDEVDKYRLTPKEDYNNNSLYNYERDQCQIVYDLFDRLLQPQNQEKLLSYLRQNSICIWHDEAEDKGRSSSFLIEKLITRNFDPSVYSQIVVATENFGVPLSFDAQPDSEELSPAQIWAEHRTESTPGQNLAIIQALIDVSSQGDRILSIGMGTHKSLPHLITNFRLYRTAGGKEVPYSKWKNTPLHMALGTPVCLLQKLEFVVEKLHALGYTMEEIFPETVMHNIAQDINEFAGPSLARWCHEYRNLEEFLRERDVMKAAGEGVVEMLGTFAKL